MIRIPVANLALGTNCAAQYERGVGLLDVLVDSGCTEVHEHIIVASAIFPQTINWHFRTIKHDISVSVDFVELTSGRVQQVAPLKRIQRSQMPSMVRNINIGFMVLV
jgi:hypothetical protein